MKEVVIVGAARTPIGKFGGTLKDVSAVQLGSLSVKAALQRAKVNPSDVQSVIFGNVLQAGLGQNPARQIAVHAGIPYTTPAMTINEVCGSGLKAVILGSQAIRLGEADIVVVGGTENMSRAPYLLPDHRFGKKMGSTTILDSLIHDGLTDVFEQIHMGVTAEAIAEKFAITREEQDEFALLSQQKAAKAIENARFAEEIVPVPVHDAKGKEIIFSEDEYVRKNSTLQGLKKSKPAFVKDGTVTAGNSSGINDGAAALVLMSKSLADERGIPYLGKIKAYHEVGVEPVMMGYAPYYAIKGLLEKTGNTKTDIDLYELNEAFASQSIAVIRNLGLDEEKVNVNGGAIALGHPIGASGSRILVTLLYEMQKRDSRLGVASLCIGGGIGIAMMIER